MQRKEAIWQAVERALKALNGSQVEDLFIWHHFLQAVSMLTDLKLKTEAKGSSLSQFGGETQRLEAVQKEREASRRATREPKAGPHGVAGVTSCSPRASSPTWS